MSSWKNAHKSHQHTHRERHQPELRKHLGLLEKRKDYIARARDHNEKQAKLKLLRQRALNKNPDEFYFHMINSKAGNGVHRNIKKEQQYSDEQIQLMETQDLKYVRYKRNLETKKIERLHGGLHIIDAANETKNSHVFFVDDNAEAKSFDVVERLNTHPALLSRRVNRSKLDTLQTMELPVLDESTFNKIKHQKIVSYKELAKRIDRERELSIVEQTMEIKNALKNRKVDKPKQVRPGSKDCAPIYKWKFERKR